MLRLRLRVLSFLLIFAILLISVPARLAGASPDGPSAGGDLSQSADLAAPPPNINADYAAVIDDNGQVLYGKDLHHLAAPASLTKIVTALVALDKGNLSDIVKVNIDSKKFEDETNGTVMGLMPGEEISLEDLLYGMLLPSANDAAITIAEHIGGGSQGQFVQMMNDKVKSLGLTNSHFVNPHGLDAPGHVSTAYEMAMLGRYAMQNPIFAKIVGTKKITVHGKQRSYNLENVNTFLRNYPGADGVKTGYTSKAKNAIVATAVRNGRRLYVSLIRSDDLNADSRKLLDYFFSSPPTPTPTSVPSPTATAAPTNTPAPTSTPVPTVTPTPTITPTPSSSPTPDSAPISPAENGSGQNSAEQGSWLEALLNLPSQAIRLAFSFIARTLP